jgi:hypothetical protein
MTDSFDKIMSCILCFIKLATVKMDRSVTACFTVGIDVFFTAYVPIWFPDMLNSRYVTVHKMKLFTCISLNIHLSKKCFKIKLQNTMQYTHIA